MAATEEEVIGVNGLKEGTSTADESQVERTEEMEGVTIGVSHEVLTASLTNLHKVSSVSVGKFPTVQAGPKSNQDRPMKDITNNMGARPAKIKSGRSRTTASRSPYSKEDVVLKRAVGDSGLRVGISIPKASEVTGPNHKSISGDALSGTRPEALKCSSIRSQP